MTGHFRATWLAGALAVALCAASLHAEPRRGTCRAGAQSVPGGAKLVTIFCSAGASEMPVVSVLVDTLGSDSPETARPGKVWVLSYTRPTLLGRAQALLPIFLPGRRKTVSGAGAVPAAVADLSRPSHQTWRRLAGLVTQAELFDVRGALVRAPTRSYRGNASSYRQMKISEARAALEEAGVAVDSPAEDALTREQWRQMDARLALSARMLGGIISKGQLDTAWTKMQEREQQRRGHNWELLRQRVEANGLYFEPLDFGEPAPTGAMVWVAEPDLAAGASRRFDRAFLGIDNPFTDEGLKHWTGYTEIWYLDGDGRRCERGAAGARPVTMIPLAVYSLSYPRVPLLLVDFRSAARTHGREIAGRVTDYVTLGVFGLTGFANWEYMAGHAAWQWYRERHGAATVRAERMKAYGELRLALLMGSGIAPELREEIGRRVDKMPLSPFGEAVQKEPQLAADQYQALLGEMDGSIQEQLAKDRGREMVAQSHGRPARAVFAAGAVLTAGLYHHRESVNAGSLARLEDERRTAFLIAKLQRVLKSGLEIEPAWDPAIVNGYLDELADLNASDGRDGRRVSKLVGEIFARTSNEETRLRCLACLARLRSPASLRTLTQLMERGDVDAPLRTAAAALQAVNQAPVATLLSPDVLSAPFQRGR